MTETQSSVVESEVRATGANIKQQHAVNMKFVDEQLKRIRHDYRTSLGEELDSRDAAHMVLKDLQERDADEHLVNEYKRLYIGG